MRHLAQVVVDGAAGEDCDFPENAVFWGCAWAVFSAGAAGKRGQARM